MQRYQEAQNNREVRLDSLLEKYDDNLKEFNANDVFLYKEVKHKILEILDEHLDKKVENAQETLEKISDLKGSFEAKQKGRRATKYINYPIFWYLKKLKRKPQPVFMNKGVHYIVALPGKGKTSLVYDIIEEIARKTGFGAYVNSNFEKEKFDDKNGKYYIHHPFFRVEEFFGKAFDEKTQKYKVMQLKKFKKNYRTIVFDELLSWLNHRVNQSSDYLEIFLALITFLAQRRHRMMDRVYMLNQLDTTDIQLMSAFNYVHEVEVKLDIPYDMWIETGELDMHIIGWYYKSYIYGKGKKNAENKVLIESGFRPRTADFNFFNTLAMNQDYDGLPEHKIEGIYR